MISSPLFAQISKRANYFGVNKSYFVVTLILCSLIMMLTTNLILAIILFSLLILTGIYLSKRDPDFFDILTNSKKFEIENKIYKTEGTRIWEA